MKCMICGRWSPPDPETGYDDADDVCPDCLDHYDDYLDHHRDLYEDRKLHKWLEGDTDGQAD